MDFLLNDLNAPRQKAIQAMRDCVPPDLWQRNAEYLRGLRDKNKAAAICRLEDRAGNVDYKARRLA